MAVGRPVIATGLGGSGEYLEHEHNALLYPGGDAEALAAQDPSTRSLINRYRGWRRP
jgi:glycosyltransferase involved in cell wall biosynthesis